MEKGIFEKPNLFVRLNEDAKVLISAMNEVQVLVIRLQDKKEADTEAYELANKLLDLANEYSLGSVKDRKELEDMVFGIDNDMVENLPLSNLLKNDLLKG